MGEWARFAVYWFAPASSNSPRDPIFGRSLEFYFFTLPALQFVFGWLLMLSILCCVIAALFIMLTSSSRLLQSMQFGSSPAPWRWLSASVAFLLVVVAARTWLGRFDRILSDHTVFGGVTYTDAHVILGGLLVICVALIVGAGIAGMNLFLRPRAVRLIAAAVPAVACFFIVQICAWYMSSFIVKPNELDREKPYIAYNIEFTRAAFNLDQIAQHEFPADVSVESADAANNQATLQNIRLWDWHALQDTLKPDPGNPHLLRFSRHRH